MEYGGYRFNRYIVECKYTIDKGNEYFDEDLIDT